MEVGALTAATHWPDARTGTILAGWRTDARLAFYAIALVAVMVGIDRTLQQRQAMRIPVLYVRGPSVRTSE